MSIERPQPTTGLRHVALFVVDLEATCRFYTELMGMRIEWQPDDDNIYLTSGNDNLALHRFSGQQSVEGQRLDHIGFIIDEMEQVDHWYAYLLEHDVKMLSEPRTHRDGARSFYCHDPAGTTVQIIYHPPLSASAS